jgi:hypothetical protein
VPTQNGQPGAPVSGDNLPATSPGTTLAKPTANGARDWLVALVSSGATAGVFGFLQPALFAEWSGVVRDAGQPGVIVALLVLLLLRERKVWSLEEKNDSLQEKRHADRDRDRDQRLADNTQVSKKLIEMAEARGAADTRLAASIEKMPAAVLDAFSKGVNRGA